MSNVKLIIELDKDLYESIAGKNTDTVEPREVVRSFQATIADAIKDGKPLVGYNGRLVDENMVLAGLIHGGHIDNSKCGDITKIFNGAVVIKADNESEANND